MAVQGIPMFLLLIGWNKREADKMPGLKNEALSLTLIEVNPKQVYV